MAEEAAELRCLVWPVCLKTVSLYRSGSQATFPRLE